MLVAYFINLVIAAISLMLSLQASDCVKQIKELLLTQCKSHADSMLLRLSQILTESVGLVINERLLNIPAEIASPMLNSLL